MKKIIIFIFVVLLGQGCCKDCTDDTNPECSNYNPCKNIPSRPASFRMYEELGMYLPDSLAYISSNYIDDGDTGVLGEGFIIFSADYPNADSYEWQIGNEARRRTGKSVDVDFEGNTERSIKITLYVKYSKNTDCFKNYNGYDTVSKTIHFTDYLKHCIWGTYIGTWSHKPNKLDTFRYSTEESSSNPNIIRYSRATGLWGFSDSARELIDPLYYVKFCHPKFKGGYYKYNLPVYDFFMGEDNRYIKFKLDYNSKTKEVKMAVLSWDRSIPGDFPLLKTYYFTGKKH
jgi:hypothetical protein